MPPDESAANQTRAALTAPDQTAWWQLPVRLDVERKLLPAQRALRRDQHDDQNFEADRRHATRCPKWTDKGLTVTKLYWQTALKSKKSTKGSSMRRFLFAMLALAAIAAPASATTIIDRFTGTIGDDGISTHNIDIWNLFGGGSLVGQRFVATVSIVGPIYSPVFTTAEPGQHYLPNENLPAYTNVMTATLSINGHVFALTPGSDLNGIAQVEPGLGIAELELSESTPGYGVAGLHVEADLGNALPNDFSAPMPRLFGSQLGPMPINTSSFYYNQEWLTLNVDGINIRGHHHIGHGHGEHDPVASVPEPSTWALILLGFVGLGVAFRARRRPLTIS
jgi:hypothetical protein